MSRYPLFDRDQISLWGLSERGHELSADDCLPLRPPADPIQSDDFMALIDAIRAARAAGRPVILMMGGHPIKLGLSRFLVDLIARRIITHLATNGAGIIHDYELATVGGTSENVPKWIQAGQFGLWRETGGLNVLVRDAAAKHEGLGEAVGRTIAEGNYRHHDLSIAAAGWRAGVPVTCHVTIGADIIHCHANCDGAALGQASLTDFLIFCRAIQDLEGGVYLNVGSAVTGPEVYLKALSMARNVARQHRRSIRDFTTAVFDLPCLPASYRQGPPGKDHAMYYYRPWKTILVRTVADGGRSFYIQADHGLSIPSLWAATVTCPVGSAAAPGSPV